MNSTYLKHSPLAILCIVSLIVRILLLQHSYDLPGDGPSRAGISYNWFLHPQWLGSLYWLPGYFYLGGIANAFCADPLMTLRIMNIGFGVASIPVFFCLIRKLFGFSTGILSATCFAFFPLHIGLSVSSLSEVSTEFFVLLALYFLFEASSLDKTDKKITAKKQDIYFYLAILSLFVCTTFRCESWTFIPLFLAYYFFRSRKLKQTICAALFLSAFPLLWLEICSQLFKQPFISFYTFLDPRNNQISFLNAVPPMLTRLCSQLGPIILVSAIIEYGLQAKQFFLFCFAKNKSIATKFLPEHIFYFLLLTQIAVMALGLVMSHGDNMQDRFMLLFMSLLLPFGAQGLTRLSWVKERLNNIQPAKRLVGSALLGLLLLNSMLISFMLYKPRIYVTTQPYTELADLARWLKSSPYSGQRILLTSMNYRAHFLPLMCKESFSHYSIVMDWWTPLQDVKRTLAEDPPKLLIVGQDDGKDLAFILRVIEFKIDKDHPLFKRDYVSVYKIYPGSFRVKEHPEIPASYCYPAP